MLAVSGFSFERHSLEELAALFLNDTWHEIVLTWFERELQPSLGIDVYAYPFDPGVGYTTIVANNVAMLVFKTELPDAVKERIINAGMEGRG